MGGIRTNGPIGSINVMILNTHSSLWSRIDCSDIYSIYHKRIWMQVIEKAFNHEAVYFAAVRSGELIDVLPVFHVRNYLLGKKLVSTPYEACNGGFSSSESRVRWLLTKEIVEYAKRLKVNYVEIRTTDQVKELKEFGFSEKKPFLVSAVPLMDPEKNWKMLSRNHRRNVRISQKRGLKVVFSNTWHEMKDFCEILFHHYKNLGIPFFDEKFFREIWEKLLGNGYAVLLLAKVKDEIVGGHLLFISGKTLISKYSAVRKDGKYSKLYASYALFWEAIQFGLARNLEEFNLGITGVSNQGLLDFKGRFGGEALPVYFYYYPLKGRLPDYQELYSSYSLVKKLWRVTPTPLARRIGQKVNEWIC